MIIYMLLLLLLSTSTYTAEVQDSMNHSIAINDIYTHYSGKQYKIIDVVWYSGGDTLEQYVVYQGLYDDPRLGKNPKFTQSLARFSDATGVHGQLMPRFTRTSNATV